MRWIETQDLMFGTPEHGGLGIEQFVEVGVANAPTLANLASNTIKLPSYDGIAPTILNSSRDDGVVFATDAPMGDEPDEEPADERPTGGRGHAGPAAAEAKEAAPAAAPTAAAGAERPADLTYTAADATTTLAALRTKVRPDQIGTADTIEALCDGVSSRRNQLLVDLGAELGLGAIDGAAEADWKALSATVTKLARTYNAVRPGAHRGRAGAAAQVRRRRRQQARRHRRPRQGHLAARPRLGHPRAGRARRGSPRRVLDPRRRPRLTASTSSDLHAVVDHAVQAVGQAQGVQVDLPATGGGEGAMVDSAALDEITASITGEDGVLASTARHLLGKLGLAEPAVRGGRRPRRGARAARRVRAGLRLGPQGRAVLRRAPRRTARRPLGQRPRGLRPRLGR